MLQTARRLTFTSFAIAIAVFGTEANATPRAPINPLKSATSGAFITQGNRTVAPFAHVRFCATSPSECSDGAGPSTVELTSTQLALLKRVNGRVNTAIEPYMPDGLETWAIHPDRGNCHDYAVTKRHELIRAGWPSASLRLAVVYTRAGEGHLVLLVRTTEGDLVLDNLTSSIVPWNKSGLRFVSVEAGDKPRVWYSMR